VKDQKARGQMVLISISSKVVGKPSSKMFYRLCKVLIAQGISQGVVIDFSLL